METVKLGKDKQIIYAANELGQIIEDMLVCAMCGNLAFFIAHETNEPLCENCFRNNLEARRKK